MVGLNQAVGKNFMIAPHGYVWRPKRSLRTVRARVRATLKRTLHLQPHREAPAIIAAYVYDYRAGTAYAAATS